MPATGSASSPAAQRFTAAVDALIEDVKRDESILAALLCGSLSHDTVWDKSDVDLVLITIDERRLETTAVPLYADGINVHTLLMSRADFRKTAEGSIRNSFMHSFLAKGRLLYTHDQSVAALCGRLHELGERDTHLQIMSAAINVLPPLYKAHKWFVTRGDLDLAALWILHTAEALARLEIITARRIADREVLPQAMALNPTLFSTVYAGMLNSKKTRASVQAALAAIDSHLAVRASGIFAPIIEHLEEVRETRSSTEIEDHFARNYGMAHVTTACEYLADQKLIGKASTAIRLTKRSNVDVQELAFFALGR